MSTSFFTTLIAITALACLAKAGSVPQCCPLSPYDENNVFCISGVMPACTEDEMSWYHTSAQEAAKLKPSSTIATIVNQHALFDVSAAQLSGMQTLIMAQGNIPKFPGGDVEVNGGVGGDGTKYSPTSTFVSADGAGSIIFSLSKYNVPANALEGRGKIGNSTFYLNRTIGIITASTAQGQPSCISTTMPTAAFSGQDVVGLMLVPLNSCASQVQALTLAGSADSQGMAITVKKKSRLTNNKGNVCLTADGYTHTCPFIQ